MVKRLCTWIGKKP